METPKIIWQTWKSKTNMPDKFKRYSKEWKKLHKTYRYILLDDKDLRDIVKRFVPQYLKKYDDFTSNIERVDFARYVILHNYGGVYADMDTLPLKNIDNFVSKNIIVLGCEPSEHAHEMYGRDKVLCNAFMISPPGKKYWKKLMKFIIDRYEYYQQPVYTTGPLAMTKFYETHPKYHSDILITDPCVFYPMKGDGTISEKCDLKDSYVVHVWENTWVPKEFFSDIRWKNKRYWFFSFLLIFLIICFVYSLFR